MTKNIQMKNKSEMLEKKFKVRMIYLQNTGFEGEYSYVFISHPPF